MIFSIKYNVWHEKGLKYFKSAVFETIHYLSIPCTQTADSNYSEPFPLYYNES